MDNHLHLPNIGETGQPYPPHGSWSAAGSFAELWALAEESVAVFLRATVFSRDDRQDLGQAIAQKAWAAFDAFRPEQGSFPAWVLGIARNEYLHYVRSQRRARVLFDSELADRAVAELTRFEAPDTSELQHALRQELAGLPAGQRELLRFKYAENLTCGQIAARLQLKEDTVRMRLSRTRADLKAKLIRTDSGNQS